jgi:phosphoribosylanthranilate isomerase
VTVLAKICGINAHSAVAAAVAGEADFIGLVFYPPSPRYLTPDQAGLVATPIPATVKRVGLFVDTPDKHIGETLDRVRLDMIQLHGGETPERVRAIRERFGLPVMKAIKVAVAADVDAAADYVGAADWLLFDALPPPAKRSFLPGGNAIAFDWRLLAGRDWPIPWMLSGGLTAETVADAVAISGAAAVDVSSGVESAPGAKDPAKIAAFLDAVRRL